MNSKSLLLLLFSFSILTVSCKKEPSPEQVAQKFLNAFNERKYDEARKYATPETGKLIDVMEKLTENLESQEQPTTPPAIEVLSHTVDGDKATVTFRESETGEEQELSMKLVEGKWLVHLTKEDISAKTPEFADGDEEGLWSDEPADSTGAIQEAAAPADAAAAQ